MKIFTRRTMLKRSATLLGIGTFSSPLSGLLAADQPPRFRIGACDWSIKRQNKPEAMEMAKQIGLDGVQLSLGSAENNMHLRRKDVQEAYQAAAKKYGVQIGGLAIGELNNVPYKSDPRTVQWVSDSIDVAQALGVRAILLAFFEKGDLRNDPQGQKVVIERLQQVAPKAEKAGVILGIESWLSAKEHMDIINAVGSKNVQVYYDVCNSNDRGYNIYDEIRWLGKEHICEFHCKENGSLLGKGRVDFKEVRKAIDDIGYTGWLQIEGAVPQGADMLESYKQNIVYMRSIFPKKA
jgi:L-ribulose-5-phosphate 3-epimerase